MDIFQMSPYLKRSLDRENFKNIFSKLLQTEKLIKFKISLRNSRIGEPFSIIPPLNFYQKNLSYPLPYPYPLRPFFQIIFLLFRLSYSNKKFRHLKKTSSRNFLEFLRENSKKRSNKFKGGKKKKKNNNNNKKRRRRRKFI